MKINYEKLLEQPDFSVDKELIESIEYKEILFILSDEIINYRKMNNLKQKELAEKLNVSQVMISKIESGEYNPTVKLLVKIWNALSTNTFNFGTKLLTRIQEKVSHNFNIVNVEIDNSKDITDFKFNNKKTIFSIKTYNDKKESIFVDNDEIEHYEMVC